MYLSDRDARLAITTGLLIFRPDPTDIDTSSIDLHLDHIDEARVWDVAAHTARQSQAGGRLSSNWVSSITGRLPESSRFGCQHDRRLLMPGSIAKTAGSSFAQVASSCGKQKRAS